jgi:hypothetical protein
VATITVVRSGGLADGATVDYATGDGTASAGTNYEATTGTLLFASGETKKTFTVRVLDDGAADGNRTIHLTLGNPGGGAVLGPQAAATLWIVETR